MQRVYYYSGRPRCGRKLPLVVEEAWACQARQHRTSCDNACNTQFARRRAHSCRAACARQLLLAIARQTTATCFNGFRQYALLSHAVLDTASDVYTNQEQRTRTALRQLLDIETQTIHTANHYFMNTVQDLRTLFSKREPILETDPLRRKFPYITDAFFAKVRQMSNQEQRNLDLQSEAFAYWKVVKKRLIDYVQMYTKEFLVRQPISELLRTSISAAVEAAAERAGGYLKLMSDSSTLERISKLRGRIEALKQAKSEVARVAASGSMNAEE